MSSDAADDLNGLRLELAASQSRESALKAKASQHVHPGSDTRQIKTLSAQNAELPALRSRFNALVEAHQSSKVARQEIAANLRAELKADGNALKSAEAALLETVEAQTAFAYDASQADFSARSTIHELRTKIELLEETHAADRLVAQTRMLRLERRIGDRDAQVDELATLVQTLEDERDELLVAAYELDSHNCDLLDGADADRRARVRHLRQAVDRSEDWRERALSAEAEQAMTQSRLAELSAQHDLNVELSSQRIASLEHDLAFAQDRMASLETEADEATRARRESEEAAKRTAGLLAQSRVAEAALNDELASAESALAELEGLREDHQDMQQTLSAVLARSNLAEHDADALAQLNAQLTGHSNHSQKVRHLERIRTELAQFKSAHLKSTADLERAEAEVVKLRRELEAYTAVETKSKFGPIRRAALSSLVNSVR